MPNAPASDFVEVLKKRLLFIEEEMRVMREERELLEKTLLLHEGAVKTLPPKAVPLGDSLKKRKHVSRAFAREEVLIWILNHLRMHGRMTTAQIWDAMHPLFPEVQRQQLFVWMSEEVKKKLASRLLRIQQGVYEANFDVKTTRHVSANPDDGVKDMVYSKPEDKKPHRIEIERSPEEWQKLVEEAHEHEEKRNV
jgi:hypothetical protein